MLKLLVAACIAAVLVYSAKAAREYTPPTSGFNVALTFDPEAYTDIRWYAVFRKMARWQKAGEFSFKGVTEATEEEITKLVEDELNLTPDSFRITVRPKDKLNFDYIVTFKNLPLPEIENYPHLELLGKWERHGERSYRLWCGLSEERFREVISQELNLPLDEFFVYNTAGFAWTKLL